MNWGRKPGATTGEPVAGGEPAPLCTAGGIPCGVTAPLTAGTLAVMLAFEAGEVTERRAADLLGFRDRVDFRGRYLYAKAEAAKLAGGGLPNLARGCRRCGGRRVLDD